MRISIILPYVIVLSAKLRIFSQTAKQSVEIKIQNVFPIQKKIVNLHLKKSTQQKARRR
jgi:hypothetical protein